MLIAKARRSGPFQSHDRQRALADGYAGILGILVPPQRPLPGNTSRALPAARGTYALVLRCAITRRVRIGRLGWLDLRPGWYVYVGSAFGPGGLQARIGHHRRVARRPHWHIDYLRRHAPLDAVWYIACERCEHDLAELIQAMPGATAPLRGFGSSDCDCPAHLFRFDDRPPPPAKQNLFRLPPDNVFIVSAIE